MREELISVVMPVYNASDHVAEAVNSILAQSYGNLEVICVDDGSTDNSVEVINRLCAIDPRVRLLQNKSNVGISSTLNHGIAESKGQFIARMDSDDIALPERIALQKQLLDAHPEIHIVGSWIQLFGAVESVWHYRQHDAFIKALLLFRTNGFPHNSILLRKSFYQKYQYDPAFDNVEDTELWCRAIISDPAMKFANIPKVLTRYRMHSGQTSSTKKARQMALYKKIITGYLEYFCGDLTEQQLQLHYHLIEPSAGLDLALLSQIGEWNQYLYSKYQAVFQDEFFAIEEKWFRLCQLQSLPSAMETYKRYSVLDNRFEFLG